MIAIIILLQLFKGVIGTVKLPFKNYNIILYTENKDFIMSHNYNF